MRNRYFTRKKHVFCEWFLRNPVLVAKTELLLLFRHYIFIGFGWYWYVLVL